MTEEEWLVCTDPKGMVEFVDEKASDRKLRLFAVACCYRIWHLLTDERSRKAVEVAERYADGRANEQELRAVSDTAASVGLGWGVQFSLANAAHFAACPGQVHADRCAMFAARATADPTEPAMQASLLRDIIGPFAFHAVVLDQAWLTPTVTSLATSIYDERGFDRMPVLADALEEAGCTDTEILGHCRGSGPHVRGCFVVDLLLGKE